MAKRGGVLLSLPLFGILELLVGSAAGVAKAVNNKAVQCQLEELQHHNRVMKSRGVYFALYKVDKVSRIEEKKTSMKR